ncbi:MAG: AraC family transcriptional regulator [Clostridiales bacterium]|nr:AraC family transcriptional regulator [Clostridiales bacterium]
MDLGKKYKELQLESLRDTSDYFHAEKYVTDGYFVHFHRNSEIYCVYDGEVKASIGEEEFTLRAGQALYIAELTPHAFEASENATIGFVLIGSRFMQTFSTLYPNRTLPLLLDDTKKNEAVFDCVDMLAGKNREFTMLEKFGYTDLLLQHIIDGYGTQPEAVGKSKNVLILDIIQYIYDHYDKDLSLVAIAEKFNYAPISLSHLFSKYVHIDIRSFISNVRLQKVLSMRDDPAYQDKTLIEIVSMCGFNSVSSFYRAYKKNAELHMEET